MKAFRALLIILFLCTSNSIWGATPAYGYVVVAKYPHSTASFTEGFFYRNGLFYESTGITGRSSLMVITPRTGAVIQHISLPSQYFGEGIVDFGANLYQWTWQSHNGFIYDSMTLRKVGQFSYDGEGWGMTHDRRQIITSDGTSTLRFRDPHTFKEVRHVVVKDGGMPVEQLNELEFIRGEIYANIWHSNRIARISPRNGHVTAWIDLNGLLPANQQVDEESVLNGIAYDPKHDRIFVTGKQWPTIFEIKLVPKNLRK